MYRQLKVLRILNGLRQKDIAAILKCSQRVYSNYERGDLDIPTDILIRLADYYGVSVDFILGRCTEKK
jgi:transcriptional regulator with XRE-family HTH domain